MLPVRFWLNRAAPAIPALVLPDGTECLFGELNGLAPRSGLQVLRGTAGDIALGLLTTALGGGTAFPAPPGLELESLLAPAGRAAQPALALLIATSGSAGQPKGVCLPWRAVAAASRMSAKALALGPGDAWLACLPLYHVGGAMTLYRCLRAGATAVVHEGFEADAVGRDLVARRITHLSLTPPMLAHLLAARIPPGPALRCVLVGGAALSPALHERAMTAGWPLRLSYGMTETCATALVDGRPLPGVRTAIGSDGRLHIATPARMAGYLDAGEGRSGIASPLPATHWSMKHGPSWPAHEVFHANARDGEWFVTGDLAAIDEAGRVRILGRADDMLVSAGVNVHPLEVEARLAACPGVREAGIIGLADPVWGDVIACAYEGEAGEAALEAWCRTHVPKTRRPRRFLRVPRLPRLASGKLDRRALPALWGKCT